MYLELAEGHDYLDQNDSLYLDEAGMVEDADSPYIYVPGEYGEKGVYVREDYFDDLPNYEWDKLMDELEMKQQGMGLFGLGKKGRARRKTRRDERAARKESRIAARSAGKTERITARQAGRVGQATAKFGGTGVPGEGTGQQILSTVGGWFGGGQGGAPQEYYAPAPPPSRMKAAMPIVLVGVAVLGLGALLLRKRGTAQAGQRRLN